VRPSTGEDAATLVSDDEHLVALLRTGDESAFAALVDRYHASMLRLAVLYVRDHPVAEEVVQEAWLGVLRGLERFEMRASLKTWIFRIVVNRAKTRAMREHRSIPFSALWDPDAEPYKPAVEPERFWPTDAPRWPGGWVSMPASWGDLPEERALSQEMVSLIRVAIDALPPTQRAVVNLRDVQEFTADEVCNVLGISQTNQRVLLHRGRSKVRRRLEQYMTRK
jgi:RNA polymerase sigma-70 factor, ECF subfamily